MIRAATLFAGGGLADIGLRQAGATLAWAVEYDAAIADVYQRNHGNHVIVDSAVNVDYVALPPVDVLWASPPCPTFSVANAGRGETDDDLALADAVCRAIRWQQPRYVLLENVRGYQHSQSYRRILATLTTLDYFVDAHVINSADLGVPQTRERLIVRARAGGFMQSVAPWPAPVPWIGWYTAIEDILHTLPPSQFAAWQLARLPEDVRESVLIDGDGNRSRDPTMLSSDAPAMTVQAWHGQRLTYMPRAFIVDGQTNDGERLTLRRNSEPVFAVTARMSSKRVARAYLTGGGNTNQTIIGSVARRDDVPAFTVSTASCRNDRAWLQPGRVVAMTPRALARFQGVPDDYELPEKRSLAARIIGNGVPPAVARTALEALL